MPTNLNTISGTVEATPADRTIGLTLDELTDLVTAAHGAGCPGGQRVRVTVGFRSQLTRATVSGNAPAATS